MGVVRRRQLIRSSLSKKVVSFSRKNRVTPSVAAPGDTNPSDAIRYKIEYKTHVTRLPTERLN